MKVLLIFCAFIVGCLCWDGTATHWCDSISFIKNTCGYPADGYYGALSDAMFPNIVKCHCTGSTSYRNHPTLGSLPKCSQAPACERNFCGMKFCVECTDNRCYQKGKRVTIQLSDACPRDHPQNVDQCVDHAPDMGYCKCTQNKSPHIDLGCEVFRGLADMNSSPLNVRVTEGECGSGGGNPPSGGGNTGCDDTPPDSRYTCQQQASWGKCGEGFMQNYCKSSCGRCGGSGGSGGCDDNPPDSRYSCQQQASWGKCGEGFMQNYCHASCGRCSRAVADETGFFNSSLVTPSESVTVATKENYLSSTSVAIIAVGGFVILAMIVAAVALSRKPVKVEERA